MKKIVLKISIVAIMLILVYSTIVNALSFTATMTPSSTTVAESNEFMVTVKVSNLDVGQNGINSLSGYLKYDTSVFEVISNSSIEGLNGWNPIYNSENGKITLTKTAFVKNEEAVFQVTFKTKSGVSKKTGVISYTSILASNSEEEIFATDISTIITIGDVPVNTANTNSTTNKLNTTILPLVPANNTANSVKNVVNNTVKNTVKNTSTYNTTNGTSENMPYTGTEDTVMYVMIVVLALALIFYIKYQKINKELR